MTVKNFFSANVLNIPMRNRRRSLVENDPDMLVREVNDQIDLPISTSLMKSSRFDKPLLRQCWMNLLRFKSKNVNCSLLSISYIYLDGDSIHPSHLHMACEVLLKQQEILGEDESKICVPSIQLAHFYAQRPPATVGRNEDILGTFPDLYQTSRTARQGIVDLIDEIQIIYFS